MIYKVSWLFGLYICVARFSGVTSSAQNYIGNKASPKEKRIFERVKSEENQGIFTILLFAADGILRCCLRLPKTGQSGLRCIIGMN